MTLDDDVAAMLEQARERRTVPLKQLVNEALREGLARLETPPSRRAGPSTKAVSLGRCLLPDLDDVAEALAIAEGEAFR